MADSRNMPSRIKRDGGPKKVYDYRDANIPNLEKLWKKRATYYRKSGFAISENLGMFNL